jgi:exodeoxyribonuclease V beta subunit
MPLLGWPLVGTHRIEASAGTGKTFALALLHTRLVVERALPAARVLAVTYTIAATQELRERLRIQLGRAAALATLDRASLRERMTSEDTADATTAAILDRRLDSEDASALAQRLRRAVAEIDLAPIHTIHAFCQRILADHALASGEPLLPTEFITSERALHDEIALDVWRRYTRETVVAARLMSLWPTHDALAKDLRLLLTAETLLPARRAADENAIAAAANLLETLRDACRNHLPVAQRDIDKARADGVLSRQRPTDPTVAAMWASLRAFADGAALDDRTSATIAMLTPQGLVDRLNKKFALAKPPASPLFDVVERFVAAHAAAIAARAEARANLLHEVRDFARARMETIKRERALIGFDDLVDRVHAALSSPVGARLANDLREQYPAALVDEFQDTDAKQWEVFRRIYVDDAGDDRSCALFLIGDPKQAIYRFRGGDVHTYHVAGESAEATLTLDRNFRSRPRMIEAVAAVFAAGGATPFGDDATRYPAVAPGGRVGDDALVDAKSRAAPALHLVNLARNDATHGASMRVGDAREFAARVAAAEIRALLDGAPLRFREGDGFKPVEPGRIAVLVNRNDEAARVQRELAALGIASITAMRLSIFQTTEAREVLWLLEALLSIGNEGRLRAALATVLVGADAAAIDALSTDEISHRRWLDAFQAWRERWLRVGALPVVSDLVAAAAPRLLALSDGERRLTNYLHVAEEIQSARARVLGEAGQADWLARAISEADNFDEAQQLRLESDAKRVVIMTLHKAKGLEFDLVFLPFVALSPVDPWLQGLSLVGERVEGRRALRAKIDGLDDDAYKAAQRTERDELLAEQLRLLYVGLTRARHAAWLYAAPLDRSGEKTALAWLLHRAADGKVSSPDADMIDAAFAKLAKDAPKAIVCDAVPDLFSRSLPFPQAPAGDAALRTATRALRRDWWVYSFSQLAREDRGVDESADEHGAEDEPATIDVVEPAFAKYAGARFGNALHDALERVDFARWRDWRGDGAPEGELDALHRALGANGFVDDIAGGSRLLASLIRDTLNVCMPEGVRLADVPERARRAEIEFHFAFAPTAIGALVALLHRHGALRGRDAFGARDRIEGLMTGRIDLVYEHDGKVYLLDYKSNRLADYSAESCARAVADSEYDLQYLIYALALHRWLRFRRAGYDYDAHFGGVRYVFCRGLDPSRVDSPGLFVARPSRDFIDALDALLAPPTEGAA